MGSSLLFVYPTPARSGQFSSPDVALLALRIAIIREPQIDSLPKQSLISRRSTYRSVSAVGIVISKARYIDPKTPSSDSLDVTHTEDDLRRQHIASKDVFYLCGMLYLY